MTNRRYSGQAAGSKAVRSWVCKFCQHVHSKKVKTCDRCGASDFEYFQSKAELKRWQELLLLEQAGQISELRRQKVFELSLPNRTDGIKTPAGKWMKHVVDFTYIEGGQRVYEDKKGLDTDLGHLKRELVRLLYGHEIKLS